MTTVHKITIEKEIKRENEEEEPPFIYNYLVVDFLIAAQKEPVELHEGQRTYEWSTCAEIKEIRLDGEVVEEEDLEEILGDGMARELLLTLEKQAIRELFYYG